MRGFRDIKEDNSFTETGNIELISLILCLNDEDDDTIELIDKKKL